MEEILTNLSDPDMMAEMAWALRDWREAAIWLHEAGAPDINSYGNRASLRERFEWYIANVPPEGSSTGSRRKQ
jgi:hypothetical protein